jgi:hypothetical protein
VVVRNFGLVILIVNNLTTSVNIQSMGFLPNSLDEFGPLKCGGERNKEQIFRLFLGTLIMRCNVFRCRISVSSNPKPRTKNAM